MKTTSEEKPEQEAPTCPEIRMEMGKFRKQSQPEPRFSVEAIIAAATVLSFIILRLVV